MNTVDVYCTGNQTYYFSGVPCTAHSYDNGRININPSPRQTDQTATNKSQKAKTTSLSIIIIIIITTIITSHNRAKGDCGLTCSVRKPAVDARRPLRKAPCSRRARLLRKPSLDAQRPSPPDAQLYLPHVDINLLTVIAHIEQLQFDIGTWVA